MQNQTPQEKIKAATLALIAEEGFQTVTSRKIAQRAGVNLAAINYYFGSKDHVIGEVANTLFATLKNTFSCLVPSATPAAERLKTFIQAYGKNIMAGTDLLSLFLYQSIKQNTDGEYHHFLQEGGHTLLQQTIQEATSCTAGEASMRALALIGGVIFAALIGGMTHNIFLINLHDRQQQETYFAILLAAALRPAGANFHA